MTDTSGPIMPMHQRLRDGFHEYLFLDFHEPLPTGHEPVSLGGGWQAELRLRDFAQDHFNLQALRELAYGHSTVRSSEPASTDQVIRQVATLLALGRLRLVRAPLPHFPGELVRPRRLQVLPQAPVEEPLRLMLKIVDDVTDEPVPDIKLHLKLPDGSEQQATTDSSGEVYLAKVAQGRATMTTVLEGATLKETLVLIKLGAFPSRQRQARRRRRAAVSGRVLAQVSQYKVRDGDTLESIAEAHELTVDQLTHFNWGTTDAEEIQGHLFTDMGCSLRDDSGKFILSSEDEPGLLYVPRPLKLDLALEERHLLRVGKTLEQATFAFSV